MSGPNQTDPRLSEVSACDDVPVIDLGLEDRTQVVKLIAEACKSYGFFQVTNHGFSLEAVEKNVKEWPQIEFFSLPVEEKLKLYSDDPSKTETFYNWRNYLRLHCYPSDMYLPEWPSSPPISRLFIHQREANHEHRKDCYHSSSNYNIFGFNEA